MPVKDDKPEAQGRVEEWGGETMQVKLAGNLKWNGTRYHEGEIVDLPIAMVQAKPWLTEVGKVAIEEGITQIKALAKGAAERFVQGQSPATDALMARNEAAAKASIDAVQKGAHRK